MLNPRLYRRLEKAFKHIRVSNAGIGISLSHAPDWDYRQGRLRAEVVDWGETYYVNCPFCTDTRKRLGINHHWASRDEKTGDDMLQLATCFNERCLATREAQKELHALVFPNGVYGRDMIVPLKPTKAGPVLYTPKSFVPPPSASVGRLKEKHSAVRFLKKRRFDPVELDEVWDVTYADENTDTRPNFHEGRIVVPVYAPKTVTDDGTGEMYRLAGWQARLVGAAPDRGAPKYLTAYGMRRNELLYGIPQALEADGHIVVVEGVTDVWRYGPGAVALFGKTMSAAQVHLIRRHFPGRPVVVLLDAEATKQAEDVCHKIASSRAAVGDEAPVVVGKLPANREDPGDCTRSELQKSVKKALS